MRWVSAGWRWQGVAWHSGVQTLTPKADPAPDSHTQCFHKGICAVCKVVQGAGLLNPVTEGLGQFGEEGVKEAGTDPAAVAGSEFVAVVGFFAAAGSSAAAVGSGSVVVAVEVSAVAVAAGAAFSAAAAESVSVVACADAADPEPQPYFQSGQRAHGLDLLPASGPAASSAAAVETTNHT